MYVTVLRASGNVQHFKESFNIDAEYEVSDNISLAVAILIFPPLLFLFFSSGSAGFVSQIPSAH